jgi:iron-sulfur cluster repair protein YtfE (RIC family)
MTNHAGDPRPVQEFAVHEHRELVRGINHIDDLARDVVHRTQPDVALRLRALLLWLDDTLVPHLQWEERVLFPELDRRTGTRWATRPARFDHQQLHELIAKVDAQERRRFQTGAIGDELQPLLFGLEALLRAHMEREDQLLLPALDEPEGPPAPATGRLITA